MRPGTLRRRSRAQTSQRAIVDRQATDLVRQVCDLAGARDLIANLRGDLDAQGILGALEAHDTPTIYNWMVRNIAYQGISDYVAHDFMDRHGSVTWSQIEQSLGDEPTCPKLGSYWRFHRCGYDKTRRTCKQPDHFLACPLPAHPLRNGRLNQSAYSLYLFMRDIADCDFVGWLTSSLGSAHCQPHDVDRIRQALIDRLQYLFGLSSKMLTMIFSDLLIGGASGRPAWLEVGAGMIVVDTLVHNFLARTGILHRHQANHLYGPHCYGANGCADLIRRIASRIDGRQFNPAFPKTFPRFVQHAIWRYCSQQGLDICNGNRINDRLRCANAWCPVVARCDRKLLRQLQRKPIEPSQ